MKIHGTSKEVGAGQSPEGQLGTVSTPTNGLHLRCYASLEHSLLGTFDDMADRLNLLKHVIVLVSHHHMTHPLAVTLIETLSHLMNELLATEEMLMVVIANDEGELSLLT